MLSATFSQILGMSLTASVIAIFIIIIRWMFGKTLPKSFSYALWGIVLLRLLLPFSLSSAFSIFNVIPEPRTTIMESANYFKADYDKNYYANELKQPGGHTSGNLAAGSLQSVNVSSEAVGKSLKGLIPFIWLAGVIGLLAFGIFHYLRAYKDLREAVLYKQDELVGKCSRLLKLKRKIQIFTSDKINTPIVCGIKNVRIILPLSLADECNETELTQIITHELVHIKRFDYILKPLSMLALCLHWLNPIIWISFILSQRDMEVSCDEKVVSICGTDSRSGYATLLIKLASSQNLLTNGGMLAFGESNIKNRVKGIMRFKKTGIWFMIIAILLVATLGIMLLTDKPGSEAAKKDNSMNLANNTKISDVLNTGLISPSVSGERKQKLISSIDRMKKMGPGVGPWIIEYYNADKIILYNYSHIVACDLSEKNKGIYAIVELSGLKVGSYQGSVIAMIYPSPDAMACLIGTGGWELDYKKTGSIYFCNLIDGSVQEIQTNYNMANKSVDWYVNELSSTMLPWYVSVKDKADSNSTAIIWDAVKSKLISNIPDVARLVAVSKKYLENIGFDTGYYFSYWWKKDADTVIGAPYRNGVSDAEQLKLSDFEIIEVNLKDQSKKLLFKIGE